MILNTGSILSYTASAIPLGWRMNINVQSSYVFRSEVSSWLSSVFWNEAHDLFDKDKIMKMLHAHDEGGTSADFNPGSVIGTLCEQLWMARTCTYV